MKPNTTLLNSRLFKVVLYVAVGLTTYWLLDHRPDFKKGIAAGFNGQAKPNP
jgi:hypothetical protein